MNYKLFILSNGLYFKARLLGVDCFSIPLNLSLLDL